jgi:glycerophosphoryl diester phosphodiesterase
MPDIDERPVLRVGRTLARADVLYKAIAFAVLTPLIGGLLRLLIGRTGKTAVADADIVLFFFTTQVGAFALILIGALILGVTAVEQACLMTIILAGMRGRGVRDALAHAAARAFPVVRLTAMAVLRVLVIVAPFLAVIGLAYWAFLTGHDINFYLTHRPPEFVATLAIAGVVVAALAVVLTLKGLGWPLVVPIVVFESMLPVRAFAESARRMKGRMKGRRPAARGVAGALHRDPDRDHVGGARLRAREVVERYTRMSQPSGCSSSS